MNNLHNSLTKFGLLFCTLVSITGFAGSASGQDKKKDDVKIPEVEVVRLSAKTDNPDFNINLSAVYYAGIHGKKTVPVIMLHDWKGAKEDLKETAEFLQSKFGYAVIVPDLRGHGANKTVGGDIVDLDKLKTREIASLSLDIEACKKFLVQKNNEGLLNIDMLVVIAVGKTCIQTIDWTVRDWSYSEFNGIKQGQDVKALVFISPEQSFKGLKISRPLKLGLFSGRNAVPLSTLIAVGDDDERLVKEARSIQKAMKKYRPEVELEVGDTEELWKKQDLFFARYSKGQGAALLSPDSGNLRELIVNFIFYRVESKKDDYPWQDRSK